MLCGLIVSGTCSLATRSLSLGLLGEYPPNSPPTLVFSMEGKTMSGGVSAPDSLTSMGWFLPCWRLRRTSSAMTAAIATTAPAIPPPIAALLDLGIGKKVVMPVVEVVEVVAAVTVVEVPLVEVAVAVRVPEVVAGLLMVKKSEIGDINGVMTWIE